MGILRIAAIGTKAFVVGGAVYYSHDYGIWGNMKETEEGYSRLKTDLQVSVRNMNILLKKGICIWGSIIGAKGSSFSHHTLLYFT